MFKKVSRTRALNKQLEKQLQQGSLAVFEQRIKKVLLLVSDDHYNYKDSFKDLHIGLAVQAQDIHFLRFKEKIAKKEERPFDVITPDEFNGKGVITGDFAPFDPNIDYDLVIAYYQQPQLYLNSVVINQKKAFKVGLQPNHEPLFHFILTTKTSEIDLFIAELLRYLRILKYIN